jgi:hypothetical protein
MHTLKYFCAVLAVSLGTTPAMLAQTTAGDPPPGVVRLGVGFDYSRGDYGFTEDTEVFSTSANLSCENSQWLVRAVIPYVTVKGPASVVGDAGRGVFAGPARPTRSYQRGLGDVVGMLTYHAHPSADGLNVDLTGRVKFPTADEAKGLGTGKTDYYAQTDLYRRFGSVTPFGTVGYRFLGDSARYQLRDGLYASVGSSFRVADPTVLGVSFDWRSRIVTGGEDAREVTVFVSHDPNDRWRIVGYVLKGFSDASADIGVGGLVSRRF